MSSSSTTPGASLVERLHTGTGSEREDAFEEIFRTHRGPVYSLCLRLCGNRALAEDALQDTFIQIYKGLHTFRGESRLTTWLYRITVRTAWRVRARHPALPQTDVRIPDPDDPHAALVSRESVRAVQAAFDALPAEQRVVVALFSVDGLTQAEIASILGIPEGTVWSRLHKARKTMASVLCLGD